MVALAQNGDVRSFNLLVERYQTIVYNVSYRLLSDRDAAADAAQDTFIAAFRKLQSFRGGSFQAWLLRIATNNCYDQLRAGKRHPQTSLDATAGADDPPRQFTDPGEAPDEHALRMELATAIQQALARLSYEHRLVVILSDVQGLHYEEIAAATGWPLGSVKSRLSRARSSLRLLLDQAELLPDHYRQIHND
ncbi:MAG: sigma-70 family RNA polymerase sigma factor [Herpetosiphon sp.]